MSSRMRVLLARRIVARTASLNDVRCRRSASTGASADPQTIAKLLVDRIRTGGPVTLADYMKMSLTSTSGYYRRRGSDSRGEPIFGKTGDFVTAPELSQLMGEMLAAWAVYEVRRMGYANRPWHFVELGPGTGALADDFLRSLTYLGLKLSNIVVHLVEVSERLADVQAARLVASKQQPSTTPPVAAPSGAHYKHATSAYGSPIFWYRDLLHVPSDAFSIYIAHEFFDALPIHKFQRVANSDKWREVLIDIDPTSSTPKFRFVLSTVETVAQRAYLENAALLGKLPATGSDHVEISPEAWAIVDLLATRIAENGGAALVVDYGHTGEKGDTFRGFREHSVVANPVRDVLPGGCDLTADVNFAHLRAVMEQRHAEGVSVKGPVSQREFLENCGVRARFERLRASARDVAQREYLRRCLKVLIDKEEMGERFRVMGIYPKVMERFPQAGPPGGFVGEAK